MMLFRTTPDDDGFDTRYRYDIEATHRWALPGVWCPVCGATWSVVGVAYPTVDLASLPSTQGYLDPGPVSPEQLDDLRQPLVRLLPADAMLPPGTEFGPLMGMAQGSFGDFAWPNPWTVLARLETIAWLERIGIRGLTPAPHMLTFPPGEVTPLVELQIEPRVRLAKSAFERPPSPPCPGCGRIGGTIDLAHLAVEANSMPADVDLFRAVNGPTIVLATERFASAVQKARLTDIRFSRISVIG
jgi:uncharacterized double-CXXCG motif protein